jgi:hypothetical protein
VNLTLDSGIWKPIEYTGTFGSAGYYLDFENSGSLGADQSGNGNNFTPTNLASTDQTTDTPTNNFNTLNPLSNGNWTLSEGNMKCNGPTAIEQLASTFAVSSGKWYWEAKTDGTTGANSIGITADTRLNVSGTDTYMYRDSNGRKRRGGVETTYGATFASTDVIGIALDMDGGTITFYKNNTSQGTAFSSISGTYSPSVSDLSSTGGRGFIVNFGQDSTFAGTETAQGNADGNGYGDFYYAPPSGYLALCTQNLATELSPTIDDGSAYFHTQLYNGDGTSSNAITNDANAGDFQPDFLWIKCRSEARDHQITDSTRGGNIGLRPNSDIAEFSGASTQFDSDGFTLLDGSNNFNGLSPRTYVAWQWKANAGTTSSNTDGATTSTVQVNQSAGFSIVTYSMGGSSSTFGHGLGKTPSFIIFKRRDAAGGWVCYHQSIGVNGIILLNGTDGAYTGFNYFPTMNSTVVGVDGSSAMVNNTIAYCFAEIEGYSKFGSYTGNGSTDGTFIYTGFRPAWFLAKRTSDSSHWTMLDSTRNSFNVAENYLHANETNAENNNQQKIDIVSNGFKIRSISRINDTGSTYIYMAFAENPFVSSTGIPVTAR